MHRSSQFAVPIFFMISGFYAYQADSITIKTRLRRTIRITLFAVLVYNLYSLQHMIRHDSLSWTFTAYDAARTVIRLLILSDFGGIAPGPMWFLCSLIEGYIILLGIKRFNLWKAGYIYAVFAFIASGVIYALVPLKWHLRGNVFMSGMSWILTGHYIAENLQSVSRISRKMLFSSALAGYIIGLLSLTGRMLFVSSVMFNLFPVSLFILAVREDSQSVKFPPLIVKIGAEYSLYVYLFHILANNIYYTLLRILGLPSDTSVILWTRPIAVAALSLALSFVIVRARDKFFPKTLG